MKYLILFTVYSFEIGMWNISLFHGISYRTSFVNLLKSDEFQFVQILKQRPEFYKELMCNKLTCGRCSS